MQFGATLNQPFHGRRFKRHEFFGVALDFVKKFRIADAGDFHGLDVTGAFVARFERGEQVEIVDDGVRRRERADEILFAEGVDAVFHADAGIGLAQGRRGNAHVAHAAMRGGGGKTGDVQQRAAADGNQIRMPVNVVPVNVRMDFGDVNGGIFGTFAAFDDERRADEFQAVGVGGKIIFNPARKVGLGLGERFVEDDQYLGDVRRCGDRHQPARFSRRDWPERKRLR